MVSDPSDLNLTHPDMLIVCRPVSVLRTQVSSTLYPLGKRMGGSQSRLDVVERSVYSCRESNPALAGRGRSLYWAVILYRFITEGVERDGTVSVATGYGLDGPGIQSRWGEVFCPHPDRPWGPPSLLCNGYQLFTEDKAAGAWRWPPTPILRRG